MKLFCLFAIALVPLSCSAATITSLDLDPGKTGIRFTLHDPLHTVHGTFQLKRGSIYFDPDSGKASGEIVVDATSGESGSGARDHRMHKDILQSLHFPEASFMPDRVDGKLPVQGDAQMDVHGIFDLHGASHEMTLHFKVQRAASEYIVSTQFMIPYVEWGLKDPSNFLLKVEKAVEIDIQTTIHAAF
jgi:polyisoprenoid-binding protein YceI